MIRPRQPGVVIAAAVLSYLQAAATLTYGAAVLFLSALLGAAERSGLLGVLVIGVGLVLVVLAAVVAFGGLQLQRGTGRLTLLAGTGLTLVFALINATSALVSSDSVAPVLLALLLGVPWPIATLILALHPSATAWLREYVGPAPGPASAVSPRAFAAAYSALGVGLSDGTVADALATYGRQALTGTPAPQTPPLRALRDVLIASKDAAANQLVHEHLVAIARLSPWHAAGVWRFASAYGLASWPSTILPALFLEALRQLLLDRDADPITYRFTDLEADIVRDREPHDSPLWMLVPLRIIDLERQQPPAPGAEPPIAELAPDEQRLIATLGNDRLLLARSPIGGYATVLVRAAGTSDITAGTPDITAGGTPDITAAGTPDITAAGTCDVYARADTLTQVLRLTGERIGPSMTTAVVTDDLAPYVTLRRPAWWPTAASPADPARRND